MVRFSDSILEKIKNRITVSDVVSQYVRLDRKGDRYWGLCPFHQEKTPSFTVVDEKGFFKCFGCGKGGSMFDFIMEIEHVDFPQAVEILAKKAGVELRVESDAEKQKRSEEKVLEEIYDRITGSFLHLLNNSPLAENARDYLDSRNVSKDIREKFSLGFAPDNKYWLYNFLIEKGYSDILLEKSGLFSKNYEHMSLFRNRIMFPIKTWKGKCVAFSGRDLSGESKAKYINTPETSIYSKRHLIFGFYESLNEIRKSNEVILCEGNFDVLALHQAGFENAVAPLGTSFTKEQVSLIKRYCNKVYVLFDSDSAGINATKKAVILCQQNDLENYVLLLTDAKDASQLLSEQGPEALKKALLTSYTGFSYLVKEAEKVYDKQLPKGKKSIVKEVVPYLVATGSQIETQGYIKLLSEELDIPEEQIVNDLKRNNYTEPQKNEEIPLETQKINPFRLSLDLETLLLVYNNPKMFSEFRNQVQIDSLVDKYARELYTVLEDSGRRGIQDSDLRLQMIEDQQLKELVVSSMTIPGYIDSRNCRYNLESCISRLQLRELRKKRHQLLKVLTLESGQGSSKEDLEFLLEEIQALDKEINESKNTRGKK